MLEFFKVNDPFRLIGVVLYALALAMAFLWLEPFSITQTQLSWIILGERAAEGFLPFVDIVDDTSPLSVGVFSLIESLFGRSLIVYEILGRLLILWQAIYWNLKLIRFRVFDSTTYIPAVVFIALAHFSFDILSLSPALLGSCFLLLALGQLMSLTVLQKDNSESTLLIGLYAGIAFGFHSVYIVFLPYLLFAGIVISGFSFKELLLSLTGFAVPFLGIVTFYYWNDGLNALIEIWPLSFYTSRTIYQSLLSWGIWALFPMFLAVLGYYLCAVVKGSTINQQKQRQLLILWLIVACLEQFIIKDQAGFQLIILIPSLTYLISQFFHFAKRRLIANILFLLLLIGIPMGSIWYWGNYFSSPNEYLIEAQLEKNPEKEVLLMERNLELYTTHRMDGPFLNFEMSKILLEKEMTLKQKARLFNLMTEQKPKAVIDPDGVYKEALGRFPYLKDKFEEVEPGRLRLSSSD